ncbi:hypothetical protein GCM10023185_30260 [Hymenobacter saemangeumensis]|uniref:STAS/SEC14 domain-containing protein n=1 Tax=Hymenobacter saemangeumensis TaxID=1084522 RepID=A0ABP8ILD8_9BACT
MNLPDSPYFQSPAATISHVSALPTSGYIRLDWQPVASTPAELRAIYEQAFQAMRQHNTPSLMTVHNNRPPLPAEIQGWLGEVWVPRAIRELGFGRCAVVEVNPPQSRQVVHTVTAALEEPLEYQFFSTPEAADAWLRS